MRAKTVLKRHHKRTRWAMMNFLRASGRLVAGLTMKKMINWGFDYALYPAALLTLGYVWGGIVMTFLAVVANFFIIKAYDWSQVDWLFIEQLKHIKEDEQVNLPTFLRWTRPILKKGDVPAFFILCWDDPVTATLYLRRGAYEYNGLSTRDWWIFATANVVGNLYWIIQVGVILEIAKRVL